MNTTVFTHVAFWLLVAFSLVIPSGIYWGLLARRSVAKRTALLLGFVLIALAGVDVYLLQILAEAAKHTSSLADDAVFTSAVSTALYILPAMFAGIGINIVSHILVNHLTAAEKEFEKRD